MAETLLKIEGITKRFGGLVALNEVGLTINKGEIYGLIGRTVPARPRCSTY